MSFEGFTPETYKFLMELRFNNTKEFFHANSDRYKAEVQCPMLRLCEQMKPMMNEIDPDFEQRDSVIVSRIYRDTRFSKDKSPYRDHMWLAFRRNNGSIGESFSIYFEISPEGYGYGCGTYSVNTTLMRHLRERMLAAPSRFLELVGRVEALGMLPVGEVYKRDNYPDYPEELKRYLNYRGISWCYNDPQLKRTYSSELTEELTTAFSAIGELYKFFFDGV